MERYSSKELDDAAAFARHIGAVITEVEKQNYRTWQLLTEGMKKEERRIHLGHISSLASSSITRICLTRMVTELFSKTTEIEDPGHNSWNEFRNGTFQVYIGKNDTDPSPRRKNLPISNTIHYGEQDLFSEQDGTPLGATSSNQERPPLYCLLHITTGFHGLVTGISFSAPTASAGFPIFTFDFDMKEIASLSQELLEEHPNIFEPAFAIQANATPSLTAQSTSYIPPVPMQEVSLDLSDLATRIQAPMPPDEALGEQGEA